MLKPGFYNDDCMQYLSEFPDNYFGLALVDPPYGIGYDELARKNGGKTSKNGAAKKRIYHSNCWDVKPGKEYFDQLLRVSNKQIIWGAITLQITCRQVNSLFVGIKGMEG